MIERDAMKIFGRQLGAKMPVQASAPLPNELARLVWQLQEREVGHRPQPRLAKAA